MAFYSYRMKAKSPVIYAEMELSDDARNEFAAKVVDFKAISEDDYLGEFNTLETRAIDFMDKRRKEKNGNNGSNGA